MRGARGLVLFDFDGTIADSLVTVVEVYNELAPSLGIPSIDASDAELRHMSPREALRARDIPLWKVPRMMAAVRAGLRDRMHAIPPFPGVDDAIGALHEAGFRCGIVSSNARENIERFLARRRIDGLEILGTGTSLFGKGAVLRKVLRKERAEAARAFYVGDEVRDVAAAAEAGMRSVAVSWGYASRRALAAAGPDFLVDHADEIAARVIAAG